MTLDVRLNNQSLRQLLEAPPKVNDQLESACRVLDLEVRAATSLVNYMGQPVELWYNNVRWFFGFLFRRGTESGGKVTYSVFDPLYYSKKTPDDYYLKNVTATQGFKQIADRVGIVTGALANTGVVFPALYYDGSAPDKVFIDLLARTYQANGKKYWYRFDPSVDNFGLTLFERVIPPQVWAFQVGVNLTAARYEESIEEAATVVKLVNRDTGKVVTKVANEALKQFGHMIHFEEVDKDQAATMEKKAQELLTKLARVTTSASIEGINPDRKIPQLYSGDVIYVEESVTKLIGAYHIRNLTQTFESDNLVTIAADIQGAPDVPEIQYEDAVKKPAASAQAGKGVQENPQYNDATQAVISKYGL